MEQEAPTTSTPTNSIFTTNLKQKFGNNSSGKTFRNTALYTSNRDVLRKRQQIIVYSISSGFFFVITFLSTILFSIGGRGCGSVGFNIHIKAAWPGKLSFPVSSLSSLSCIMTMMIMIMTTATRARLPSFVLATKAERLTAMPIFLLWRRQRANATTVIRGCSGAGGCSSIGSSCIFDFFGGNFGGGGSVIFENRKMFGKITTTSIPLLRQHHGTRQRQLSFSPANSASSAPFSGKTGTTGHSVSRSSIWRRRGTECLSLSRGRLKKNFGGINMKYNRLSFFFFRGEGGVFSCKTRLCSQRDTSVSDDSIHDCRGGKNDIVKYGRNKLHLDSVSEGGSEAQVHSQVPHSRYEQLVRRLYQINMYNPVKLGLENMKRLHDALGSPMDRPGLVLIHIAGTNGKGSVAIKLAKTLELSGLTTGLFVSPHISSFRERMQVNGKLISEKDVERLLPKLYEICETENIPATFFEVTTALAFSYFSDCNVDAVVIETGLGGRLDATNVVVKPSLCVITSIGLEHTRILGNTVELIAAEKAGIIKPNVPVLVGSDVPHDVIRAIANENGSEYHIAPSMDSDTKRTDTNDIIDYDVVNSQMAKAALNLLQESGIVPLIPHDIMEDGTSSRPPCRFENITVTVENSNDDGNCSTSEDVKVILDVAHNPIAVQHMISKIDQTYPGFSKRFVVGFSSDKDLGQCAMTLYNSVASSLKSTSSSSQNRTRHYPEQYIHLVRAAHPRAASIEDILKAAPALQGCHYDDDSDEGTIKEEEEREPKSTITKQVQKALRLISRSKNDDHIGEILIICGSVFIMSEAREALGYDEPRDSKYISEVAGSHLRHGQDQFASNAVEDEAVD